MKTSLVIIGGFLLGCVAGREGWLPDALAADTLSRWALYVLMFLVGMSIGADRRLGEIVRSLRPRLLLVPAATIAGTLSGALLASLAVGRWSAAECLAVGSGMGYYSLSSILITQLKTATIGAAAAAELGTVALAANLVRELFTLLAAPLLARWAGPLGPINAAGATSLDSALPVIILSSGSAFAVVSIFHGIVMEFSIPLLVSLFCAL